MKKKYLYQGEIIDADRIGKAAANLKMDVPSYIQKHGIKEYDESYEYQGEQMPFERVHAAALKMNMDADAYIDKYLKKKDLLSSGALGVGSKLRQASSLIGGANGSSQSNGWGSEDDPTKGDFFLKNIFAGREKPKEVNALSDPLNGVQGKLDPAADERIKNYNDSQSSVKWDDNDPVKSLVSPLQQRKKEVVDRNIGIESTGQNKINKQAASGEVNHLDDAEFQIKKYIFPTTESANNWLETHGDKADNHTAKVAHDIVVDDHRVKNALNDSYGYNNVSKAAINYYAQGDNNLGEQLRVLKRDGMEVPQELEAQLAHQFFNNRTVQELAAKDHDFNNQLKSEQDNLYTRLPEAHDQKLLSDIADYREKNDYNNWFANFPGVGSSDKVAQALVDEGKWSIWDKKRYDEATRLKIMMNPDVIPTPGILENTLQTAAHGIEDIPQSAYKITGLQNLVHSKGEILYDALKDDLSKTTTPDFGGLHKFSSSTGNLVGFLSTMMGGAKALQGLNLVKDAEAANKISMAMDMYSGIEKEETKNNPDNPLLAKLSAGIQTGVWMKFNETLPKLARGIVKDLSPEINTVLKDLQSGAIDNAVAKQQLVKTVSGKVRNVVAGLGKTVSQANKGALEVSAITATNDIVSGLVSGNYNLDQSIKKTAATYESMLMGGGLLGAVSVYANRNSVANHIDHIAENPEYYSRQMDELAKNDPEFAKQVPELKKNLEFLKQVKEKLNEDDSLTDSQKKQTQIIELQKKILDDKIKASPADALVRKETKDRAIPVSVGGDVVKKVSEKDIDGIIENGVKTEESDYQIAKEIIAKSLGTQSRGVSDYNQVDVGGKKVTVRVSDHEGNEPNFDDAAPSNLPKTDYQIDIILDNKKRDVGEDNWSSEDGKHYKIYLTTPDFKNDGNSKYFLEDVHDEFNRSLKEVKDHIAEQTTSPKEGGGSDQPGKQQATQTGEPIEPVKTGTPPPGKPGDPVGEGDERGVAGIAAIVRKERAAKLGTKVAESGEGWSPEDAIKRGKELREQGIDPDVVLADFNRTNAVSGDMMAVAANRAFELAQATEKAGDEYVNNPTDETRNNYAKAQAAEDKWLADVKPMQTEWQKSGAAQQGVIKLDYNSFSSVKKEFVKTTTGEPSKVQEQKIKKLTEQNKKLQQQADELEKKNIELTDKALNEGSETTGKKSKEKKTHEDYVKDRKDSFTAAREALKKLRTGESGVGVGVPLVRELVAVAPHMAKVVKSLIEEGVNKLGDIVDVIHEELSKDMAGLRRRDVYDLVAGDYIKQPDEAKPLNEYADIKKQAKLVKKLQDLQNGLPENFDNDKPEQTPEVKKLVEQIKKVKQDLAAIGYMKDKPSVAKVPITAAEKNINMLEKELDNIQQGKVKEKSEKREPTQREKELQDEIFEEKKKLGLVSSKVKEIPESDYGLKITAAEKKIKQLEKEKDDLANGIVKQREVSNEEPSPAQKEKIESLQEDIYNLKKDLGVLKSKGKKPLTEAEQKELDDIELEGLQKKFAGKKDNKFSIDESKAIWNYAKKNYLDKGVSYRDMIKQVSQDLGLKWKQVSEGITSPKTKPISDAMWKKQGELRRAQNITKTWINAQSKSIYVRKFLQASAAIRGLQVFGHAGVFMGTHAGMTLAQPRTWQHTIPAFFRAYRFAYGNEAAYERSLEELKSRPLYTRFERLGLKNNPDQVNTEEFQKSQTALGGTIKKIGMQGIKGFNALKVLRQDLAEYHYNKLTEAEKADDGAVKSIVKLVNNATGATNLKVPELLNETMFAFGMESARWGKLTRNPMRATAIAIKALLHPEKATTEERVFAKVWASRVGEQLATYTSLLFANAAIQSMVNPNNPTNILNPNKKDWLRPKFGSVTVDPTSGMLSTIDFSKNMVEIPFKNSQELQGDTKTQAYGKAVIGRFRGKLAPAYSTLWDMVTQTDYNGNQLPLSNIKPDKNHRNIGWLEWSAQRLPIPVAEGLHEMFQSAAENGSSPTETANVLQALLLAGISGTTGARASESQKDKKQSQGNTPTIPTLGKLPAVPKTN